MIYLATPGFKEWDESRRIFYNHVIGSNGERGIADFQLVNEYTEWEDANKLCIEQIELSNLVIAFPGKGYNDRVKSAIKVAISKAVPIEIIAFKYDARGILETKRERDRGIKDLGTDINLKQYFRVRECYEKKVKIILPNSITPWCKHLEKKYQKIKNNQTEF